MAARQDQTLQIFLIITVICLVLALGFLYYNFRLRAEHLAELKTVRQSASEAQGALRNKVNEANSLRTFMGFPENEDFASVSEKYEQDMQQYGATFDAENRSYRSVLQSVFEENRRSTNQESEAKEQVKELNTKLLALEAAKEKQIEAFQSELDKVKADAASERNKFSQARTDLEAKRDSLAQSLERQRREEKKRSDVFRKQIAKQDQDLKRLEENVDRLIAQTPVASPSSEIADGRITWVNQTKGTAWIDLGSADSLRRQVTFSVFEQDATDAGKAEKKGSLEVIRILGDHSAEVQITSDNIRNPILPGDWIYSQVWHRGRNVRFALTGVIDFNGDGRNDIQQAKDLIALNGATLDAVLEDDGSVNGEITVNTRYLVLGDFPAGNQQAEQRKGWKKMSDDAETLGVDKITLQQFLDQMGYRPADRTVGLGRGSRASDFSPQPSGGSATRPSGGSGTRPSSSPARRTLYATP